MILFLPLDSVKAASKPIYSGQVTAYSLTVRSEPTTSSKSLGYVHKNDKLDIYAVQTVKGKKWYEISYKNRKSYVSSSYVKTVSPAKETSSSPTKATNENKKGKVTATALNIRSKATVSSSIVGVLKGGQEVTITGSQKVSGQVWYQIAHSKGSAFVSGKYIKIVGTTSNQPAAPVSKEPVSTKKPVSSESVKTGKVTASLLNVRSGPSTGYKVTGNVKNNTTLEILSSHTTKGQVWYKVRYSGKEGYVSGKYVKVSNTVTPKAEEKKPTVVSKPANESSQLKKGVITAYALNVRSNPSLEAKVVGYVKKNNEVTILSSQSVSGKTWHKIRYGSKEGYVSGAYVKVTGVVSNTTITVSKPNPPTPPASSPKKEEPKEEVNTTNTTESATPEAVSQEPNTPANSVKKPLDGKVFVVDAGHGGSDPGAVGNGAKEKDLVLDVSNRITAMLKDKGATVHQTRSTDKFIPLSDRVVFANSKKADAFISVHINAAGSSAANGIETWYNANTNPSAQESKELAIEIQQSLIQATSAKDRGVKSGDFYVIKNTKIPAVLLELGFISNQEEASQLKDSTHRQTLSDAVVKGVLDFYQN